MDYPAEDRDPLESILENDTDISVGVHKVGQAPRIPPVCIYLKNGKVESRRLSEQATDLVISNQNRFAGQLEPRHPTIPPSYHDPIDLFHRERARAISFEGNDETRRCEPLTRKYCTRQSIQWKPSRREERH
jgi:hypothetical protein